LGGKSRAGQTRLATRLGLTALAADPAFRPYKGAAESFRRAQVARLAATCGGGECGPAPSSIVASAALQLAASRYLFDHAKGDAPTLALASRLANDSRQNLLAAFELAAREAEAKPTSPDDYPWLSSSEGDDGAPWSPSAPDKSDSDDSPVQGEEP
jgi:hypothetical protein